MLPATIKI